MNLVFLWPSSAGEWLAMTSAVITIVFGLLLVAVPRWSLALLRLQTVPAHPEAVSEARATMAGFYLGIGLCAILLAQPMLWLALGAGWAFTALGRLISIAADRGNTPFNWLSLAFEVALAAAPLGFALGYF